MEEEIQAVPPKGEERVPRQKLIAKADVESIVAERMAAFLQEQEQRARLQEKMNNELLVKMTEIVAAAASGRSSAAAPSNDGLGPVRIPSTDLLDKPVVFWCNRKGSDIVGDMRGQEWIPTPYSTYDPQGRKIPKPIKFQFHSQVRQGMNSKEADVITKSTAVITTKAELEFMRNHSEVGIVYHETSTDADKLNARQVEAIQEAFDSLRTKGIDDLARIAKPLGVQVTDNITLLRRTLSFKMAEAAMSKIPVAAYSAAAILSATEDPLGKATDAVATFVQK